jgi:predicted HTH transcriptional regulator
MWTGMISGWSFHFPGSIWWQSKVTVSWTRKKKIREKFGDNFKITGQRCHLTILELAEEMNISTRAVEKHLQKLREADKLKCVGPTRGGHWEVRSAKDPGGNADE